MNINIKNIVLQALLLSSIVMCGVSCSKEEATVTTSEDLVEVNFSLSTRSAEGDETYCFALFSSSISSAPQWGFYSSAEKTSSDYTWLTPTNNGDDTEGLIASAGTYTLAAVSPAVAPSSHTVGDATVYGYELSRRPEAGETTLYVGDVNTSTSVVIDGVETGGSYVYTFDDDYTLKEPRVKLQLYIYNALDNPDGNPYYIKNIYFSNTINKAIYNPTVGYYVEDSDDISPYTSSSFPLMIDYDEDNKKIVATEYNITDGDNIFYFLAADYTNTERFALTPELNIEFTDSNGAEVTKTSVINLLQNFDPQTSYNMVLCLESTSVTLTFEEVSWDTQTGITGNVTELPSITASIETTSDWTENNITGSIDNLEDNE